MNVWHSSGVRSTTYSSLLNRACQYTIRLYYSSMYYSVRGSYVAYICIPLVEGLCVLANHTWHRCWSHSNSSSYSSVRSQGKLHTSGGLERKITEQTSIGREYRKHLRPTTAGSVQSIAWGKNLPRVELEKSNKAIVLTRKTGTYTGLYLLIMMIDDDVEGAWSNPGECRSMAW